MLLTFFVLSLAVLHLTTILSESFITEPLRQWVLARNGFIGYGVNCFFCTSTWVSLAIAFLWWYPALSILNTLIFALAIASIANSIKAVLELIQYPLFKED